jgi:hypothetical protein
MKDKVVTILQGKKHTKQKNKNVTFKSAEDAGNAAGR